MNKYRKIRESLILKATFLEIIFIFVRESLWDEICPYYFYHRYAVATGQLRLTNVGP